MQMDLLEANKKLQSTAVGQAKAGEDTNALRRQMEEQRKQLDEQARQVDEHRKNADSKLKQVNEKEKALLEMEKQLQKRKEQMDNLEASLKKVSLQFFNLNWLNNVRFIFFLLGWRKRCSGS